MKELWSREVMQPRCPADPDPVRHDLHPQATNLQVFLGSQCFAGGCSVGFVAEESFGSGEALLRAGDTRRLSLRLQLARGRREIYGLFSVTVKARSW